MSRTRSFLINIGLLIGSLTIVITLGEIGLRVTGIEKGRVSPPPIYQRSENPDISYELKPHLNEKAFRSTIVTDSKGFRSAEPDPAKPSIAVLGDSMTFGYGVENNESLPGRLGALLPAYNVTNAGVPGYNLTQERATFEQKLQSLRPEILVLVFYWNDLRNMEPAMLSDDGNLHEKDQVPPPYACSPITEGLMNLIPGKCWLDTHSAIYRTMKKFVVRKTIKQNQAEQEVAHGSDLTYEYLTDESLQNYAVELSLLQRAAPNVQKLFVIWPETALHFQMRPRLKAIAEERGFQVLDLYELFGNDAETLSWDSIHPSPKTLEQAAKAVKAGMEYYEMLSVSP